MNLASHGTLAAINYQLNEMTAPMNSSRLPESQSYSQISMLNKNAMLAVARHHGSTSSSEERTGAPVRPVLNQMANSEVSLKQSLR